MEANPIEQHMRAALRMRVLRDVELDEARRWSAVFGRATDHHARVFLRRQVEPHIARARKFNRQMVIAQRGIRSMLERREVLDLIRATFAADWRGSDGKEVVAGTPASIQREGADVRSIERAPAIVDGLVATILRGRGRARAGEDGRGALGDRGGDRAAVDRGRAQGRDGSGRARRRQASRLIAFLLAIGAGGSSSGCAAIGATPWSELSTGEKIVNVGVLAVVAAVVASKHGDNAVTFGNAKPERCDGEAAACAGACPPELTGCPR